MTIPSATIPNTAATLRATPVPPHIFLPRGMIVPEEQILLYLLARDVYQGRGAIVDAGAFCGASAYAFSAGLTDNPRAFSREKVVHSYDLFQVDDSYTRQYIQNGFYYFTGLQNELKFPKHQVQPGESFLEVFRFQTQRYNTLIEEHPGSILDFTWPPARPIEILFIDVAKTQEIQQHLFAHFLPCLVPGGVLLQQDFHHAWHPYIHVAMEYLAPCFEITHSRVGATRAYRLSRPIPEADLRRVVNHDFTPAERADLMARCVASAPAEEQPLLQVVQARDLSLCEDAEGVRRLARQFVKTWSAIPGFTGLAGEFKGAAGPAAAAELALAGY